MEDGGHKDILKTVRRIEIATAGGGLSLVDPRTGAHQPPAITGPTRLDVLLDEIRRLAR